MTAAEIIRQVHSAGGQIASDGADLVLTAPHPLPADLLDSLKAHKPALLEALAHPDDVALWWRIAITETGGRTIEVDAPSGWTLADWQAYAERYHGPGCAVTAVLPLPKPRAPVLLDEALRAACEGVAGITPAQFRALLSLRGRGRHRGRRHPPQDPPGVCPVIRRGHPLGADRRSGRRAVSRYGVFLADPPWQYRAWKGDRGMRTAESFYPTMSAADLHALRPRIDEWAARDCALFLWATPPALPEALELVGAWGFIYTTFGFTWIKTTKAGEPKMGMGWHTRANAEICLLAKRGKPRIQARDVPQVIMAVRRDHSHKPDEQYARIERLYGGPYLELFARHRRDGWDVWGDEAPRAGALPELSSRSSTTPAESPGARC